MAADGIVADYALGGAMAALFYMEPAATYDMDVFILLDAPARGPLPSLAPLYAYLKAKGRRPDKEHVLIGGVPVQFLPAYNPLVEEAVKAARRFY